MATFDNGESGLSVRTKINNVLQHADGTAGELVINEAGADVDFRVESDTNANALFVDGATGNMGIGTNSPAAKLDIFGGNVRSALDSASAATLRGFEIASGTSEFASLKAEASTGEMRLTSGFFGFGGFSTFHTNGSERLRIDASGNLLAGTTGGLLNERIRAEFAAGDTGITTSVASTAAQSHIAFYNGAVVGSIGTNGSATSYNTSSDYRLKEDLRPIADASSRLAALNPVNFAWKADGTRTDGFIAHEVQAVAPQAVTGEKDGEAMQAIDHSKLVPLLTAALQEALAKIALLETRITALEA